MFTCFLKFSPQKANALDTIKLNIFVFVMENQCVFWEAWIGSLSITYINFELWSSKLLHMQISFNIHVCIDYFISIC